MADSQKLIDNVSKMPPEAQQHPQVQADLEQAKKVVAEDEAKNEGQKQPGASDSGNAGNPPESQARIPDNTNSGTEGRPAADDSQRPRPPGSEAKDAPPVPAATHSGPTSQTAASDSNSAQTPPVPSSEQPPSTADKKGETQATPPLQPTTPPKSVEDSRKVMENVSKMPPEAQQHPQVQADLEQAKKVLQEHVQKLETQKGPLSEAQKKDLADAKAALARQAPGRAASIPDTGKETPPADAAPAARTQQPEPAVRPEDAARPAEAAPEGTQRQRSAEAPQTDAPDGKKLPQGEPGNAGADAQRVNTETGHADAEAGSDVRDRQPSDPARSTAEPADASTGKRASTGTRARISPEAPAQDQASGAERSRDGSAADASWSTIPEDAIRSDSDLAQPKAAAGDEARSHTPTGSGTNVGSSSRTASSDQPTQTSSMAPRGPGEGGSPGQPSSPFPTSLPPPRTPPLSVEQSQRLIDNVSKMPPEARQHPQVQADVAQARDVVAREQAHAGNFGAISKTKVHPSSAEAVKKNVLMDRVNKGTSASQSRNGPDTTPASSKSFEGRRAENAELLINRPERRSPLSNKVTITTKGLHGQVLRKVALLCDMAHDDGKAPPVELNDEVHNAENDGEYRPGSSSGKTGRASVKPGIFDPLITGAHELGHHIAQNVLSPEALLRIRDVARDTTAWERIIKRNRRLNYFTDPEEVFCRAYSQFVALRSGDPEMLVELEKTLKTL